MYWVNKLNENKQLWTIGSIFITKKPEKPLDSSREWYFCNAFKSICDLMWSWPLTSWPSNLVISCPFSVDHSGSFVFKVSLVTNLVTLSTDDRTGRLETLCLHTRHTLSVNISAWKLCHSDVTILLTW